MISLLYLNQFYETEQGVGSSPKRNSCCIVSSRLSILLLCSHRTNRTRLRDELCAIGKLKEGVIRQRQRYRLHFFSCSHQQAGFLHGKGHLLTLLASFSPIQSHPAHSLVFNAFQYQNMSNPRNVSHP